MGELLGDLLGNLLFLVVVVVLILAWISTSPDRRARRRRTWAVPPPPSRLPRQEAPRQDVAWWTEPKGRSVSGTARPTPRAAIQSPYRPAMPPAPPPKFDLLLNEPGQALTRRAKAETGSALGESSWHRGAEGEEITADYLEFLRREGWYVMHSIELHGGGDIDHLAIGPSGIFVINSKHYAGARVHAQTDGVFINGARQNDFLERARSDASIASDVISEWTGSNAEVTPVLAFVKPGAVTGTDRVGDVLVAESKHLVRALKIERERLLPREVRNLGEMVRDSRVWSD